MNPVETSRVSFDSLTYALPFYKVMRTFAGSNFDLSVQLMRMFNVLIASVMLFWALRSATWPISRALALSWGVAMIPLGIFFVASVNPSSWVIIGVGTYWAFLASGLSQSSSSRRENVYLILGAGCSVLLALSARIDAGIYLALSSIEILIWRWQFVRYHLSNRAKFLAGSTIAVVVVILTGLWSRKLAGLSLSFPGAQTSTDQPNPVTKTLLEVPSFVFGLFGGQSAQTTLREGEFAMSLEGYRPVGFIQGLGWTETQLPSMVGLITGAAVFALILIGLRRYEGGRFIALLFLVAGFIAQILFMRARYDFTEVWLIQPRYFFPIAIVIVGVALTLNERKPFLNKLQASLLAILLTISGSVAWLATSTRYALGSQATYTNFGQQVEWWWPVGPGRLISFAIVVAITCIWTLYLLSTAGIRLGWATKVEKRSGRKKNPHGA